MNSAGIPIWREYPYRPPPELSQSTVNRVPLVIVGGGPIGLALALDLANKGHQIVLLNAMAFIPKASKAICFSKRTLDIWDRLGIDDQAVSKGVVWEKGKVFWKDEDEPVYEFDLLPVKHQKNPAFINLQQYYTEEYFLDEIERHNNIDIRWQNEVVGLDQRDDHVKVFVSTPDGEYELESDYLLACDGNRSKIRQLMGLDFQGRIFEDNFLIADVRFKQNRPAERWFRFDPPYPGASSLIHKQPDDVWRLDFQLGWDIDKQAAIQPENVDPFVQGFLGPDVEYEYVWLSVYTFQCRRMERFVHNNIIFAGDSAHLVSPFGARGCNGGYADIDNLAWKLDRVLKGESPPGLLETYNYEAIVTADENILNSSRSTDFMTPKSSVSQQFRDAVLELSRRHSFARPFVNSGRLSTAVNYPDSPLNTQDSSLLNKGPEPGHVCIDAPVKTINGDDWLLGQLGNRFVLLALTDQDLTGDLGIHGLETLQVAKSGAAQQGRCLDVAGYVYDRYGVENQAYYLIRPDQYVAARWTELEPKKIESALRAACLLE